jgi:predicted nucleic-acid-binding Zn-ribbon protein
MKSSIDGDDKGSADQNKREKSSKCPKCLSGDMVEHPSFLSVPFTSRSKTAERLKTAIEDQDADFIFKFVSCRKCGYSEFYIVTDAVRNRI